jgi:septum site-determining protein MinC
MKDIVFKGSKYGINILLDPQEKFEEIKKNLTKKVFDSKNFFSMSKDIYINFTGRSLTKNEEDELLNIITTQTGLNILHHDFDIETKSFENKNINEPCVCSFKEFNSKENDCEECLIVKNSLRSGQFAHHSSSVIILGDINSGAEVISSKNIIVMGKIKGLAHAGYRGDKNSIVSALQILPTQIRISNIITCIPKSILKPSYAYIKQNQIYISNI